MVSSRIGIRLIAEFRSVGGAAESLRVGDLLGEPNPNRTHLLLPTTTPPLLLLYCKEEGEQDTQRETQRERQRGREADRQS